MSVLSFAPRKEAKGVGVNGSQDTASVHERWARFRFAIIGPLLAAPPKKGELLDALRELAMRTWRHPITGADARFSVSTIERWYYAARSALGDPVGALRRKVRSDLGVQHSVGDAVDKALREQYERFKTLSVYLHYLNLKVLVEDRILDEIPSYSTVRRFFRANALRKRRRVRARHRTPGIERAEERLEKREVVSWEAEHVNSVWHWDGHVGSRQVLTPRGEYETPILIGIVDDRSRLACHLQWYYGSERAEIIADALSQAIMKRGLPAAGYHDNGSAMIADEMREGLLRLGVVDARTLPHSAYMNGKIEVLWGSVESQLMAMLDNRKVLTLDDLNEATQAWCEGMYNRSKHSETRQLPIDRFVEGPHISRREPDSDQLRLAFTREERRTQRHSDGTVPIKGRRFEVPNCYRHMHRLVVRYAHWDLSYVHLVDDRTSQVLCQLYPQDKAANARGVRRPLEPIAVRRPPAPIALRTSLQSDPELPPLMRKLLKRQADTGLPPGYRPLKTGYGKSAKEVDPAGEIDVVDEDDGQGQYDDDGSDE
jgi:putative transposase